MQTQESYELSELRPQPTEPTQSHQDAGQQAINPGPATGHRSSTSTGWSFKKFWADNVNCVVDFDKCRDHLALERTFLAYLRTALMSAIAGTLVAQLFVLEQQETGFGYSTVGRPLASLCYVFSICTVLMGASRVWRHQHAMISGKALTGGFEIVVLTATSLVMVVVFFGFLMAIDIVLGDGHS